MPGVNYISTTDKSDTISYLPASKMDYIEKNSIDPYSDNIGRVNIKIGRLVFKLFPKKLLDQYVSPSDIEEFVNIYKSFFDKSNQKMIVVSGEEIRQYYLDENYCLPEYGTLWKSCMRYSDRQKFLDLYTKNSDVISMLVLLTKEGECDKVRARALLWEAEDLQGNKLKIMDRIYTIYDSDVFVFKKWARQNGYISKLYQNAKSHSIFDVDGKPMIIDLKIFIENHDLEYYPYLDTFPFYDGKGNFYNNHKNPYEYILIQSNGSLYPPEPEPEPVDEYEDDLDYEDPW